MDTMKVGVLQFFSWPRRKVPLETVYERALSRIDVMDQNGYDAVWLAEHHFTDYSVCPSVHLMGMHVANRTRNLRIGMAVSLAALYHPLRLAEEVALLDVLSGGRVNWGAGRGFDPNEFAALGVPLEESRARFQEAVEIVLRAWTEERITYKGAFHQFEDVELLPKPLQQPHPPTWVAATSPEAITWAGSAGHDILLDPHCSGSELAKKRALYHNRLAAAGHACEGREIPVARLIAVAESEQQAEEIAKQGVGWFFGSYGKPEIMAKGIGQVAKPAHDRFDYYMDEVILRGTPARLVDQIAKLQDEAGVDYLMCAPLSHESFELFTDRVLPRL